MPHFRSAPDVNTVAVLGAGTMGRGIAYVAALSGCTVRLRDIDHDLVERALADIAATMEKGVQRGKLDAAARDAALPRLHGSIDLVQAVAEADVVIEAAPEILELKREIFAAADQAAPAHALLASNTSSLAVADIAAAVREPARVLGMHFFNPVHIMKLLEVVVHEHTADEAAELARGLAARWGKEAITVRDSPGFASSRLGLVLGLEAMRMLESGVASAADIDTAMRLGYGHPMGPLELTDLVGLDVRLKIAEYLATELGPHFAPPAILRDKVEAGELGRKSGQGFFPWQDGKRSDR
ncbi:3-hydroxyacyl-CoA dehydrogenase family protein [Haliangium ochraceum]|uniref:3-hydroxybutyryl-CoA dehydrogenase n=1 Tax=Haliangium ochraceum (strain DSM 14365 / JCM 11303 / SMP-2) TaxID=502025 RepID=D0LTX8_HALO1|nr:3-hydroxyacyl-CoA dehydrogenase family protein [Haliangium ochraceum]ACY15822.1 3-hydroxybutyryl-CoA dehydrogenase [Haliangium ochraceum DSM 14365]